MNTVKVRNVIIGEGIPKICVPIFEKTAEEILSEAKDIAGLMPDIAEFRADRFEGYRDAGSLRAVLAGLRDALGEIPVLFTIRTSEEGGEAEIGEAEYAGLIEKACESGSIDMVDVEALRLGDAESIIEVAHSHGVKVVASHHDFEKTPTKDEIIKDFTEMLKTQADILKIAVMPQGLGDVKILMEAAEEMSDEHADRPIIAISMSDKGTVSRIAAEAFGSAVTFGAASKASAPGQIGVEDLREALEDFHESLDE
ncbi:MAG: type I 3-dehydroquinate dehydratase [Mogibacterium sp.]|nr:type I 3-dehydroquinate dehydratase [Mogibacterium sp.]